ncbi:hypothetical protein, partial [Bartonella sp. ML70XJBT.G]|uniref:hypothetical protein n=1 Tax=Bartonella sp. ML70XJBT.G TaxID=3019093 RepID=UPI0023620EA3
MLCERRACGGVVCVFLYICRGAEAYGRMVKALRVCWWIRILAAFVERVVCGNGVARGGRGKALAMDFRLESVVGTRGVVRGDVALLHVCGVIEARDGDGCAFQYR